MVVGDLQRKSSSMRIADSSPFCFCFRAGIRSFVVDEERNEMKFSRQVDLGLAEGTNLLGFWVNEIHDRDFVVLRSSIGIKRTFF